MINVLKINCGLLPTPSAELDIKDHPIAWDR